MDILENLPPMVYLERGSENNGLREVKFSVILQTMERPWPEAVSTIGGSDRKVPAKKGDPVMMKPGREFPFLLCLSFMVFHQSSSGQT